MKLLIATHNPAKSAEFKKLMAGWPFQIVGLTDLGIKNDVEENGETFEENALLKADYFHKLTELATLADDGGMEIDALNGEPGVKSRRWRGYKMSDQEMVDYTLERLRGVQPEKRTARMKVVLCLKMLNQKPLFAKAAIEGVITEKQESPITEGYPFRSILFISKLNKMFADLTDEEHAKYSQRADALRKLKRQLGRRR
ncbi:non-canonical purine NTP pyrophosphatase [Candidatus Falkowbacteria bacterium]|nr:non-canonical purine NTP pyrophosphatase [Candidatus Falkowbacteria bacterium]